MHDIIRARRDALATQMNETKAQYDQLEATLKLLGRNLDAMQGGLKELDALLKETPGTPTNGTHQLKTGPVEPLVPGWP